MTASEIENATLEAIYWWNRDEYYYHKYFSQLDIIYQDKTVLDFFTRKVFEVFLKEYSVRRNLSSGVGSVISFIDELFEHGFFANVQKGETDIIDDISNKLKKSGLSTKRSTKSLLSKVAFLINPNDFSLYDTLSRESIWSINKNEIQLKRKDLNSYNGFLQQTNLLQKYIADRGFFQNSRKTLNKFKETESFKFFSENSNAFEMRIVDKFLWLFAQYSNGNKFDNIGYIKLNKLN